MKTSKASPVTWVGELIFSRPGLSRAWRWTALCLLAGSLAVMAGDSDFDYEWDAATGTGTLTDYHGYDTSVVEVPSIYWGTPVTAIGESTFSNCNWVTSVTIPDSVTSIGEDAFYQCSALTSVMIGNGVTTIGEHAFADCVSLASVVFGDQVTTIGAEAFEDCASLPGVTIPDGVTTLASGTFKGCGKLASVTFPDGLTRIGGSAFLDCGSLTAVTFPDGLTSIGDDAFNGCSSLKEVTFPDALTVLGTQAFAGCGGLTGVALSEHVTTIGEAPFVNCQGVLAITVAGSNPAYASSPDGVLFDKGGQTLIQYPGARTGSYVIPDGVTAVGRGAFGVCPGLSQVRIPDSVITIASGAFAKCPELLNVIIGNGVTDIGPSAFWGCAKLQGAYFKGNAPTYGYAAFVDTDQSTVYCPGGDAIGWGDTFAGRPTAPWTLTVNLEAGAGYVTPVSKSVVFNATYGALPTPVRSDYTFTGWRTADHGGGVLVTDATVVSAIATHTLYATYVLARRPTVTTTAPIAIGTTTATSGGNVTSAGSSAVTARGVCWSTAAGPTVADDKTANGTGTGVFDSLPSKLRPATTYYVRAYATNGVGTAYGEPLSVTTPPASGPDLVVTSIVLAPALPAVGGKFTATITVKNQGILSGKAGNLYVWLDKPGTAAVGEKGDKSASVSTLKPGVSKTVKMSLTAPKTWGTFTLRAFIDAKNVTAEDDEYNNQETFVYDTGLPDFRITGVRISPELPVAGKTFTAYVTVINAGEVAGNAGYLDLWADSSALPAIPVAGPKTKGNKSKTVGTLLPGQEKLITVTGLKAPEDRAAPVLGLLVDGRAKAPELNEGNNWVGYTYRCE
jgi:hypothetical protein